MPETPVGERAPVPAEVYAIAGRVPGWEGRRDLEVVPTAEGLSFNNLNYRVTVDGAEYILRVGEPNVRHLGVRRADEREAVFAASRAGICPEVLYFDADGNMVTAFVSGRHWEREEFHDETKLRRLAETLRRLHAIQGVPANGSVFRRIESLLESARAFRLELPANLDAQLTLLGQIEAERKADPHSRPGLVHGDLWFGNFLDDGERLYLLDWEFGGTGDGLYDLATVVLAAAYSDAYSDEEQAQLLRFYGYNAPDALLQLKNMIYARFFFEGAWSLVQHRLRGSEDYDLRLHSRDMFQRLDDRLEGRPERWPYE
jgi:thiamine kinase-like enzyme